MAQDKFSIVVMAEEQPSVRRRTGNFVFPWSGVPGALNAGPV